MRRTAAIIGLCASVVVCAVALAATPIDGAKYKGHTKQNKSISFRVKNDGIRNLHYKLNEHCSNGTDNVNEFTQGKGGNPYPIADDGSFSGHQDVAKGGVVKSGRITLTGMFVTKHKATGKIKDKIVFKASDGRGTCKGSSKFTVKTP
jgi:hypothetical protein